MSRGPRSRGPQRATDPLAHDIWLRTTAPLAKIAEILGLVDPVFDSEDHWQWVIGDLEGQRVDVTRTHTVAAESTDTRIFLVELGAFPRALEESIVQRLVAALGGPVYSGRWTYLRGQEFELTTFRMVEGGG